MNTNMKRYVDAFEDQTEEDDLATFGEVEDQQHQYENEDYQDSITGSESDYEVELFSDEENGNDSSEDEQEELEIEDAALMKAIRLNQLRNKYAKPLEECNSVLKGKLNWVNHTASYTPIVQRLLINDEFPSLSSASPNKIVDQQKSCTFADFKTANFPVKVMDGITSKINFQQPTIEKIDRLCKYINEGAQCPFGEKCRFTHTPKKSACKKGKDCTNRKCNFFHPLSEKRAKPERNAEPRRVQQEPSPNKSKKIWFCKNLIRDGTCKFGNDCMYAHSNQEVKDNVSECKFGDRCRAVKKLGTSYVNCGEQKCVRLHTRERIGDFIKRMQ